MKEIVTPFWRSCPDCYGYGGYEDVMIDYISAIDKLREYPEFVECERCKGDGVIKVRAKVKYKSFQVPKIRDSNFVYKAIPTALSEIEFETTI